VKNVNENNAVKESEIVVELYLESLTDPELETICVKRGFDITLPLDAEGESRDLQREDYLEAAKRCLSLENEVIAVLAENSDLAFELEAEIERMRLQKELLLKEREDMLAEKPLLEQKLKEAGIDVSANGTLNMNTNNTMSPSIPETPENLTLEQALKESITLLFRQVHRDMKLVASVLSPVLKPVGKSLSLVWRYSKPTVEIIARKALLSCIKLKKNDKLRSLVSATLGPLDGAWRSKGKPLLTAIQTKAIPVIQELKTNVHLQSVGLKLRPDLKPAGEAIISLTRVAKSRFEIVKATATTWIEETECSNEINDAVSEIKDAVS
jgi:hypothetical protein